MAPRSKNTSRTLHKRIVKHVAKPKGVTKIVARKKSQGKWPLLAQRLSEWYHRQDGSIPDAAIKSQAKEIFVDCYEDTELPKFSDAWIKSWKIKYASYYDEQMLVAASKKLVITEPVINESCSVTVSSNHPTVPKIEPSNQTRVAKLVTFAATSPTSSSAIAGPANNEGSRNHNLHSSHESSTVPDTRNESTSTYTAPHVPARVRSVPMNLGQRTTRITSKHQIQDGYRAPSNNEVGGATAAEVQRDETIAPVFSTAGNSGFESLPSTRVIASLPGSATVTNRGKARDGLLEKDIGEQRVPTLCYAGGEEVQDPIRAQEIVSQQRSAMASKDSQTGLGLDSQALNREEPSTTPLITAADGENEDFDPTQAISGMDDENRSCATTLLIASGQNSFVIDDSGQIIASSSAPGPSHTEPINGVEDETESLASTVLVVSRPGSLAEPRRRERTLEERAFGTWAFDAEVQDAPSFRWPDFDDAESLASTLIIDY